MIVVCTVPLYWGVETEPEDRSFLTGSWMVEDMIPFRQSVRGIRIRVSHRHWLHVGIYRYRRDALHSGLNYKPYDISKWKWGRGAQTQGGTAVSDEVRPDEGSGPGDGAGDIPLADGEALPGDHAQGDRQSVAPG